MQNPSIVDDLALTKKSTIEGLQCTSEAGLVLLLCTVCSAFQRPFGYNQRYSQEMEPRDILRQVGQVDDMYLTAPVPLRKRKRNRNYFLQSREISSNCASFQNPCKTQFLHIAFKLLKNATIFMCERQKVEDKITDGTTQLNFIFNTICIICFYLIHISVFHTLSTKRIHHEKFSQILSCQLTHLVHG